MKKYNILIVEDEFINAQFIEKAVLKLGHNVIETVETGQESLKIIEEKNIHVVFMDINLEGNMDGIQCATLMNEKKNIPIIYTTAFFDNRTIDEATNTNLFGYLIKPFDYQDIEVALAITIKKNYLNKKIISIKNDKTIIQLSHNYVYNIKTQSLQKESNLVQLTKKESEIFYHLVKNLNQTTSLTLLYAQVWEGKAISSSTLRETILRLRKKIPNLNIRTISGVGYALESS